MTIETAATAKQRLDELKAKQRELNEVVAGVEARRKKFAFAAATGDAAASAELAKIDAEEAQARTDLRNIALAITEAARLYDVAWRTEADERGIAVEIAADKAIDELLVMDDALDDALDSVRALFLQRREFIAANKIRGAAGPRELEKSLEAYFSEFMHSASRSYREITRVAQWDGRVFDRKSPGMSTRPPRELTALERALLREPDPRNDMTRHWRPQ